MSQSVLVTGGAGFIGSCLSEMLLQRGCAVRVLDNLSLGRREWVPAAAEFIQGDIRDLEVCRRAVAGCSAVFHMAAMSRSAASLTNIEECTSSNVLGTQNILGAARDAGVRKVIYSGSSTYYGNQPAPHHEKLPGDFLNFYGLTKYVGEEYCLMFDRLYGLPCVVLRYFNVYGPRQPEEGVYALVLGVFLTARGGGEAADHSRRRGATARFCSCARYRRGQYCCLGERRPRDAAECRQRDEHFGQRAGRYDLRSPGIRASTGRRCRGHAGRSVYYLRSVGLAAYA